MRLMMIALVALMMLATTCSKEHAQPVNVEKKPFDTVSTVMNAMDTMWRNVELSMRVNMIAGDLMRINRVRDSILVAKTGKTFEQHLVADTSICKQYAGLWKMVVSNKESYFVCNDSLRLAPVTQALDGSFSLAPTKDKIRIQPMNKNATLFKFIRNDTSLALVAYAAHTKTGRPLFSDGRTMLIKWQNVLRN